MSTNGTVGGNCKVCGADLYFTNTSGVCREHMHSDACQCEQCRTGQKSKLRIRTRDELVALGLLPEQRIFAINPKNETVFHDSATREAGR